MSTRVTKKEIKESLEYWQKVLKLTNWTIEFAIVSEAKMLKEIDENQPEGGWDPADRSSASAFLVWVKQQEQCARILFHKDLKKDSQYGPVYNVDTLCIHELIHIMVDAEFKRFPKYIRTHKKVHALEEWLCNRFSKLLHDFGETGVFDAKP